MKYLFLIAALALSGCDLISEDSRCLADGHVYDRVSNSNLYTLHRPLTICVEVVEPKK